MIWAKFGLKEIHMHAERPKWRPKAVMRAVTVIRPMARKVEIISVPRPILTEAQSQGTTVASTVAHGRKTQGISRLLIKSLKSSENPGSPANSP